MIRRLVDANYLNHRHEPTPERLRFWFRELRTPELLMEVIAEHQDIADDLSQARTLLGGGAAGMTIDGLARALHEDEVAERQRDAAYWKPLRERLEVLRRAARES